MINDLRRRAQEWTVDLSKRITPSSAVALCIVGFVIRAVIRQLSSTSPHTTASKIAVVADSDSKAKAQEEIAQNTAKVPKAVDKPPAVDRLVLQLYAEYPELSPNSAAFLELDDWGKVLRLREFSYRHTAFANRQDAAAHRAGADMVDKLADGRAKLAETYDFFDRAQGGVSCSQAAELLQRLYTWAGFEAFDLKFGFDRPTAEGSNFTHSVNLVRIKVAGPAGQARSILSVHDPSLNVSYGDSQGRPIDYFEVLQQLVDRQAEQIHFAGELPAPVRRSDPLTVAFDRDLDLNRSEDSQRSWNLGVSPSWSATADSHWVHTGPRTIWAFESFGDTTWKPELFNGGLPPETIYLHCFPLLIRGTPEGPALLKHAKQVLSQTNVAATDTVRNSTRE